MTVVLRRSSRSSELDDRADDRERDQKGSNPASARRGVADRGCWQREPKLALAVMLLVHDQRCEGERRKRSRSDRVRQASLSSSIELPASQGML